MKTFSLTAAVQEPPFISMSFVFIHTQAVLPTTPWCQFHSALHKSHTKPPVTAVSMVQAPHRRHVREWTGPLWRGGVLVVLHGAVAVVKWMNGIRARPLLGGLSVWRPARGDQITLAAWFEWQILTPAFHAHARAHVQTNTITRKAYGEWSVSITQGEGGGVNTEVLKTETMTFRVRNQDLPSINGFFFIPTEFVKEFFFVFFCNRA